MTGCHYSRVNTYSRYRSPLVLQHLPIAFPLLLLMLCEYLNEEKATHTSRCTEFFITCRPLQAVAHATVTRETAGALGACDFFWRRMCPLLNIPPFFLSFFHFEAIFFSFCLFSLSKVEFHIIESHTKAMRRLPKCRCRVYRSSSI